MRVVFGFAAAGVLLSAYVICPDSVRASFAETVTPEEHVLEDMQDGVETIMAYLKGVEPMTPDNGPAGIL